MYGGINLEDISAPRCFEIEARLRELLDIPVFHDDQHGTAIVVLAALTNALRVVGKRLRGRLASSCPASAPPGTRSSGCCTPRAPATIVGCDRHGAVHAGQPRAWTQFRALDRRRTPTATGVSGTLKEVLAGADVFIGVSAPNLLTGEDIATMAPDAIVFALANPDPEVDPIAASEHAAVVATGRSDYPNQINNVLAFPGFFRGLLDAGASDITDEMLIAAATAIADCVEPDELNASYIVPSVFDPAVAPAVAAAVRGGGRCPRCRARPLRGRRPRRPGTPGERAGRRARRAAGGRRRRGWRGTTRARRPARQPVHTVYVPADRYAADTLERWRLEATAVLDRHAAAPPTAFPEAFGHRRRRWPAQVHDRVRAKLEREPVEDLRIDFEDGYGDRGDDEEDLAAVTAATALRHTVAAGEAAPFGGIRFKSFEAPTRRRGLRTLELFVGDARRRRAGCRTGSCVTLPKVTSVDQVEAMVLVCERLEQAHGLAAGRAAVRDPGGDPAGGPRGGRHGAGGADGPRVGAAGAPGCTTAPTTTRPRAGSRRRTRAWSTRWPTTPRR